MLKTRRRRLAANGRQNGRRKSGEANAGLKAELKEKLPPSAGAREPPAHAGPDTDDGGQEVHAEPAAPETPLHERRHNDPLNG